MLMVHRGPEQEEAMENIGPVIDAILVPEPRLARLNVTWNGQNGDIPDPVPFDASDDQIRLWVWESLRGGGIPGLQADPNVTIDQLRTFKVDRYAARDGLPDRLALRPKAEFGAEFGA
jgi:hypothetical protein